MFKKFIAFICIFVLIINFNLIVIADDYDEIEESLNEEEIEEVVAKSSDVPIINSRSAVIFDRKSKEIIYGKAENERRKMASTTKILTSLVILEKANLNDVVIVSKKAAGIGGSRLGLSTGDKITVKDLLYGLMLCSGNDAAVALAEYVGESVEGFQEIMNKKASELGLKDTHFVTPHGLDAEEHYTTAYELALITDYALNMDEFRKIVGTKYYTISINGNPKNIHNTNELLGVLNGVYGVKTGFTNGANRCLVTAVKRENLDIICVVLGADTKKYRTSDSVKLIEYAFNNYEIVNLTEIAEKEFVNWKIKEDRKIEVNKGKKEMSNIIIDLENVKYYPIKHGEMNNIKVQIECEKHLEAPIYKDQVVGFLSLKIDGKEILNRKIIIENDNIKKTCADYFVELLKSYNRLLTTS